MKEMPFKCNDIANFNASHMPSFSNSGVSCIILYGMYPLNYLEKGEDVKPKPR